MNADAAVRAKIAAMVAMISLAMSAVIAVAMMAIAAKAAMHPTTERVTNGAVPTMKRESRIPEQAALDEMATITETTAPAAISVTTTIAAMNGPTTKMHASRKIKQRHPQVVTRRHLLLTLHASAPMTNAVVPLAVHGDVVDDAAHHDKVH